jgi:hypothetical protein
MHLPEEQNNPDRNRRAGPILVKFSNRGLYC